MLEKISIWCLKRLLKHLPKPDSYAQIVERHEKEIKLFQDCCSHKQISFRYVPFAVCQNCQKFLREMTKEESEEASKEKLFKLNKEIKEFGIQLV